MHGWSGSRTGYSDGPKVRQLTATWPGSRGSGLALREARPKHVRAAASIAALVTVGWIVSAAIRHDPPGFQLQGSAMVVPGQLQAYASGYKIFGEYGDPWDLALGVSWFPMSRRELRVNVQGLYLSDSRVGYNSVPFPTGGNGWVFSTDVMVNF